jgi:hypothetical protein
LLLAILFLFGGFAAINRFCTSSVLRAQSDAHVLAKGARLFEINAEI